MSKYLQIFVFLIFFGCFPKKTDNNVQQLEPPICYKDNSRLKTGQRIIRLPLTLSQLLEQQEFNEIRNVKSIKPLNIVPFSKMAEILQTDLGDFDKDGLKDTAVSYYYDDESVQKYCGIKKKLPSSDPFAILVLKGGIGKREIIFHKWFSHAKDTFFVPWYYGSGFNADTLIVWQGHVSGDGSQEDQLIRKFYIRDLE